MIRVFTSLGDKKEHVMTKSNDINLERPSTFTSKSYKINLHEQNSLLTGHNHFGEENDFHGSFTDKCITYNLDDPTRNTA